MKKFLVAITLLATMSQAAFAGYSSFGDVKDSNAFLFSIQYLKDGGIIDGYDDGSFKPSNKINRAEMLKILIEGRLQVALNNGESMDLSVYIDDECFNDVPADEWYTPYVCYAKDKGIVQGYTGNLFKPTQYVTFVEAMKMTLETYGYLYDENSIWYKDIVEQASAAQFIPLNINDFNEQIDRSQMADIIARVLNSEADTIEDFLGDSWDTLRTYEDIESGDDDNDFEVYKAAMSEKLAAINYEPVDPITPASDVVLYANTDYEFEFYSSVECVGQLEMTLEAETGSALVLERYALTPTNDPDWSSPWIYYGILDTVTYEELLTVESEDTPTKLLEIDGGEKVVVFWPYEGDRPSLTDDCISSGEGVQARASL